MKTKPKKQKEVVTVIQKPNSTLHINQGIKFTFVLEY